MHLRRLLALAAAGTVLTSCASGGASAGDSQPAGPRPRTSSSAASAAEAAREIGALTHRLGPSGISVEALRSDDGTVFRYGASSGMVTGSIAKLYILEALLLQLQNEDEALDDADRDAATRMIENSDNDAADDLYAEVGTVEGLNDVARRLGVHHTQPGTNYQWGFTKTCAADYIALLRDLIAPSALSRSSRLFALGLMAEVESDQRWGVSAAADPGTTSHLKNGWLASDPDGGRWLVNSVGVVTVQGHQVLLAVLTQHGDSFQGGIDLVEKIAKIAADTVA